MESRKDAKENPEFKRWIDEGKVEELYDNGYIIANQTGETKKKEQQSS